MRRPDGSRREAQLSRRRFLGRSLRGAGGAAIALPFSDMPFWIAGGRGRFRAGELAIPGRSDVDLYNTILRGLGVNTPFGDPTYFEGLLPQILA